MRASRAMPPGRSSSKMSDPYLTGRWWNYNSQHHSNAAWEEERLSLLWSKSRPELENILLASQEKSSKKRMELSRWKRLSRKLNPKVIPIGSFEKHGPALGVILSWKPAASPSLRFLTPSPPPRGHPYRALTDLEPAQLWECGSRNLRVCVLTTLVGKNL